jgi:hypothetical protein
VHGLPCPVTFEDLLIGPVKIFRNVKDYGAKGDGKGVSCSASRNDVKIPV